MAVYDSVLFFNELDLLEIRLNVLNDCVDHFIISECDVTFSGLKKPFYYLENVDRFKAFQHKIIYQQITDTPSQYRSLPRIAEPANEDQRCLNQIFDFIEQAPNFPKDEAHWGRDFFQRECLRRAYLQCKDDDIIIFSDVDEIPNPNTLKKLLTRFPTDQIFTLIQNEHPYYLNTYQRGDWMGPRVANYRTLKNLSLNKIRTICGKRKTLVDTLDVEDGGWHFSNLGGLDALVRKIESWGHQELNTPEVKRNLRRNVAAGRDVFERKGVPRLRLVQMTAENLPDWVVRNQGRFQHLIRTAPFTSDRLYSVQRIATKCMTRLRTAFRRVFQ